MKNLKKYFWLLLPCGLLLFPYGPNKRSVLVRAWRYFNGNQDNAASLLDELNPSTDA